MPILAHLAIGALGTYAFLPVGEDGSSFLYFSVAAAYAPDWDFVASFYCSKRKIPLPKWLGHQMVSHNIFLSPFYATLLYYVALVLGIHATWAYCFGHAVIHLILDTIDGTAGPALFAPFSWRRYSLWKRKKAPPLKPDWAEEPADRNMVRLIWAGCQEEMKLLWPIYTIAVGVVLIYRPIFSF